MKRTFSIGPMDSRRTSGPSLRLLSRLGLVLLFLPVLFAAPMRAQVYLANLEGVVSDPSGAKVAGAVVTVTDTLTNFATSATTNDVGAYSIPFLTPDTYTVKVAAAGFKTETRTGVVLTAGTKFNADFSLKIGTESQNITVSATPSLLNTESADLGATLTTNQVTDFPNLGRVPFMPAAMAAGIYNNGYANTKTDTTLVPWGGGATAMTGNGIAGHTNVTIDGSPDNPLERAGTSGYGGYTGITPSPESVQEVKIQTALYDAEFGHGSGTVLNTVFRSGTSEYHGAAYFVFRNTYMDANTHERVPNQNAATGATPRVNETWNEPGFTVAGPAPLPHYHKNTYFMVAYERIQLRGTEIPGSTDFVPTAAMANGDFSALCPGGFSGGICVPGGGVQIYDPLTLDVNNNRTAFANNQIPSNRWNATGAALLKYYPAPNSTVASTVNYVSPADTIPEKFYSVATRIDHSIDQNHKWSATFYNQILNQIVTNQGFPTPIGPTSTDDDVYRNNHGGNLDYIAVLPHTWVIDGRLGVIFHPFGVLYKGSTFNLSNINMSSTGIAYQSFPGTSFSDSYSGLQAGSGSQISNDTFITGDLTVSKAIRTHNLRFGSQVELHRYNAQNPFSGLGTFSFDRRFTQKNSVNTAVGADAASGNPIASMLLGFASGGSYANQVAFATSQLYHAYFLQDDWRVNSNLTINAGLRWDQELPFTERYNRLSTGFCTTCVNPLQASVTGLNLFGGLTFASPANRRYYKPEYLNWQPRFGLSYRLPEFTHTVLHGGAGLIYFNTFEGPVANGFSASTSLVATTDNTHPYTSLSSPFPSGVVAPSGSSLGLSTLIGQGFSFITPNFSQPRNFQWTVSEQTQLPLKVSLQVAYSGNRSWSLENTQSINPLPENYYNHGQAGITYLQTQVANPMAGLIPTNATLNGATIQQQYLLLPFPEFGGLSQIDTSNGGALYNGLQVTGSRPMTHNLSILGSFTWAHMMVSTTYLNAADPAPYRYQDTNPTLLGGIYINYKLPAFSALPKVAQYAVGGWQANIVSHLQNGTLVSNPGSVTWLSNPHLPSGTRTYSRYFNTCYLNAAGAMVMTTSTAPACDSTSSIPAFQQHLNFTLNNTGPEMSGVRVWDHPLEDVSLFKVFQIHEKITFELRGEFFNVLNTPNYGGPGTSPGSSTYGVVTLTQQNDPRIGQLTGRINF